MDTELIIHFDGPNMWWAELTGVPGFTASAATLAELRDVVDSCLPDLGDDVGSPVVIVHECLAPVVDSSQEVVVPPSPEVVVEGSQPRQRPSAVPLMHTFVNAA